jgi:hypothetical protein
MRRWPILKYNSICIEGLMTAENIFFRTVGNRSEIRNPDFQNKMKEYQPIHRTILGYGCGCSYSKAKDGRT